MCVLRHVPIDTGGSVGNYCLGRRLGAGGMGAVYEATRRGLRVAIKIPYCELLAEDYALRRFRDEAIAGSIVSHPNIARVLEWGDADGIPYLVMEHVAGERLTTYHGLPSLDLAAVLVGQLLDGLAALHDADIVHGDVKTDNIMLARGVKLIDFGLAHVADDAPSGRLVSGTPEYMAPEVIRGEGSTPASDVYSAAIVLYELVTGQTPFGGGSSSEIVQRHLRDQVVPPSVCRPDRGIPPVLDQIILRALQKHPTDRFPSAKAFASNLAIARPRLCHARRTASRVPRGPGSRWIEPPRNDTDTRLSTFEMPR